VGFPGSTGGWPVFPMDEVLELAATDTRVEDFFNFKLFVVIDDDRRRWILDTARDVVRTNGFEERHVEHGMHSHRRGQLKTEGCLANLVLDGERTETLVVKLVTGASGLDVATQEPYLSPISNGGAFLTLWL